MELKIYAIYDNAAQTYNTPYFQPGDAQAVRMFRAEVNRADTTNLIYLNPEDFDLYYLGTFDTTSGTITPTERPTKLVSAVTIRKAAT